MASTVTLRAPTSSSAAAPADFQSPSLEWLMGEWTITHSSLPMWKDCRNVRLNYKPLSPSSKSVPKENSDRVDDQLTYQKLDSTKIHTVGGVDTASNPNSRAEWDWRGSGWLKMVTSHWEVLGWGEEEGSGHQWLITMFAKTMFSPAGIDIYCRTPTGLKPETLETLKAALVAIDDEEIKELAAAIFAVTVDDGRK